MIDHEDVHGTFPRVQLQPKLLLLEEQLGLKLESQKGDSPVLVIDHIERPSEN